MLGVGGGGEVEQDGRLAGIRRRVDPGVEPVARARGRALAEIEGGGDARVALRPGDDRAGEQCHDDAAAQGEAVELDRTRRRLAGPQS